MYLNFKVNQFTNCKTILIFLISIALLTNVKAQNNLVPNPSFEVYSSCPNAQDDVYKAVPWFNPTDDTPDYHNSCNTTFFSVPSNWRGFQYARTGSAYPGMGMLVNFLGADTREYIEVKLIEPLKKGYRYSVEYYVSLSNISMYSTDAMGAYIGDSLVKYTSAYIQLLDCIPQINNPKGSVLKDTLNWVRIGGIFKSEGGEQFITIGNFTADTLNKIDTLNYGTDQEAYYFIDDVSVVCLNCDSTAPGNNLFIPDAFSPNSDGNNDKLFVRGNNIQELYFAVYDRWGEKVFETIDKNNGWDGTYKGNQLSGAVFVYYCMGKYMDGVEFKQKGDVTLVR